VIKFKDLRTRKIMWESIYRLNQQSPTCTSKEKSGVSKYTWNLNTSWSKL